MPAIKLGCAGDLGEIILLLRNECQNRPYLPVTIAIVFVTITNLIFGPLTESEIRHMGRTGVGDRTGNSVWMALNGSCSVHQVRFWRVRYIRKKKIIRIMILHGNCCRFLIT